MTPHPMLLSLEQRNLIAMLALHQEQVEPINPLVLNWVSDTGGLPEKIKHLKKDLERDGHPESAAVAIAVSAAKRFCAKGHEDWCAAVADWERKKAQANAT